MSRKLTLIDAGWESVKAFAARSHRGDAVTRVEKLLSRPDLPAPVAADARRLVAELLSNAEKYPEARRHLSAAAELEPGHAHTQYLLGVAHADDPLGEPRKAAARFRKAAELDPANPLYRAAYGRAAVRCDRPKAGVKALLAAADAAGDDVTVVRVVVEGLLEAGKNAKARRVVAKAMFLCPANRELKTLRDRATFAAAASRQRHTRRAQDAQFARDGGVAVLPFIRVVRPTDGTPAGGGTIRRDLVSKPQPHFPRLRVTRADR
jgi:tetratricopeptide (TPR) repeat protein